ncbi:nitroreductase family protein [Gramella sp. AN32]|uniref:Nitroreductase family protein n=1 Tax=Christiangramia antarctica TaxID=2058158 RepID=A0ABW5X6W0_9FLAO|nr:nitroreductase family protein [Gramella sp. AN32]MCM4158163.1 nitroreductase family protein [Gramella sp. AN32]
MAAEEKIIQGYRHIAYKQQEKFTGGEMLERSSNFYSWLEARRSVRHFSEKAVSEEVIQKIILSAGTAPSGADKQPWSFCAVSNPELKIKIRNAAEEEEQENYKGRMSERWLKDLEVLGTNTNKEFLEIAPWLIVAFKKVYELDEKQVKRKNYYVNESVGIACGMLISAIHNAGLVTLTHTPSPMNFLAGLLQRPKNERAYLLLPVGHPSSEAYVPDIRRKKLQEISDFYM